MNEKRAVPGHSIFRSYPPGATGDLYYRCGNPLRLIPQNSVFKSESDVDYRAVECERVNRSDEVGWSILIHGCESKRGSASPRCLGMIWVIRNPGTRTGRLGVARSI